MDDALPDPAFIDGVRDALAEPDSGLGPADDGITVAVTSLTPVTDGAWPELEVAWRAGASGAGETDPLQRTGTARFPVGRDWLDLSFYPEPADYARMIERELHHWAVRALHHGTDRHDASADFGVPDSEVSQRWAELISELEDLGSQVREVRPGRVEVVVEGDDGRPTVLTFLISPRQWAELRRRGHGEYGIEELIGAYEPDETFFHFDGDGFTRSIREELPPVRGTAVLRRIAAARERDPEAAFGWFAYAPEADPDPGHGTA